MKEQRLQEEKTVGFNQSRTCLKLIDQNQLPNRVVFLSLEQPEDIWRAIHTLQVRGAPAIGVAAAIGLYLAVKDLGALDFEEFYKRFLKQKDYFSSTRPTAINLFWALDRMEQVVLIYKAKPVPVILELLAKEAALIESQDVATCKRIGQMGFELIRDCKGILTHCNAGSLAAVKYGTALAPIYVGMEQGVAFRVFVDETRPLLQGARLTAFELARAGVDVTLLCDNMAGVVLQKGWVQAVLVGADRVAANGDTANKIGTSSLSILAKYYGVPFYVAAPTSTLDLVTKTGEDIVIEQRSPQEVTHLWYEQPMAPAGIRVFNPAFDVTPNENITAIITEKGVVRPPYTTGIASLFQKKHAWPS